MTTSFILPFLLAIGLTTLVQASGDLKVDVYFSPTSPVADLQSEYALMDQVIAARQGNTAVPRGSMTFSIRYSVYNLLDPQITSRLCKAHAAGVYVQVLIWGPQLAQPYVPDRKTFTECGMTVAPQNVTQADLSPEARRTTQLIPINVGGLMHTKMRLLEWTDAAKPEGHRVLVTGSLNPDGASSVTNNETLLVIREAPRIFGKYNDTYHTILNYCGRPPKAGCVPLPAGEVVENDDAPGPDGVEFFYSKGRGALVRCRILDLVRTETEFIGVSVYALTDVTGFNCSSHSDAPPYYPKGRLVDALCDAKKRGVGVAVVTDKDESDGEPGANPFTRGDPSTTAWRLRKCGIPTYKAKNYESIFSAFHHKNAVFGLTNVTVVTDTANWGSSAMGYSAKYPANNSETTLVIDSSVLDGNVLGMRFLSNFFADQRSYEYQQACPYHYMAYATGPPEPGPPHPVAPMTANCGCAATPTHGAGLLNCEPFHQPDWTAPGADAIVTELREAHAAAWPRVSVTLVATGVPGNATRVEATIGGHAVNLTQQAGGPDAAGRWTAPAVELFFAQRADYVITAAGDPTKFLPDSVWGSHVPDPAYDWAGAGARRADAAIVARAYEQVVAWPTAGN